MPSKATSTIGGRIVTGMHCVGLTRIPTPNHMLFPYTCEYNMPMRLLEYCRFSQQTPASQPLNCVTSFEPAPSIPTRKCDISRLLLFVLEDLTITDVVRKDGRSGRKLHEPVAEALACMAFWQTVHICFRITSTSTLSSKSCRAGHNAPTASKATVARGFPGMDCTGTIINRS